jgi:voltage-gated potassium channel
MIRHFFAAHLGLLWELSGALAAFGVVIVVAGVLVSRFDKLPLGDAIYFAFITAFTVGFGDVTPKSHAARVVTIVLSFMGLLLVGVVVAVAVHSLDLALQASRGA